MPGDHTVPRPAPDDGTRPKHRAKAFTAATAAEWFLDTRGADDIVLGSHMRPMLPISVLERFAHDTPTWAAIERVVGMKAGALLVPECAYAALAQRSGKDVAGFGHADIGELAGLAHQDLGVVVTDDFRQILLHHVEFDRVTADGEEQWTGTRHRCAYRIAFHAPGEAICCVSQETGTVTIFFSPKGKAAPVRPVAQQIPLITRVSSIVSDAERYWDKCVENLELVPIEVHSHGRKNFCRLIAAAVLARRCAHSLERLYVIGGKGLGDRRTVWQIERERVAQRLGQALDPEAYISADMLDRLTWKPGAAVVLSLKQIQKVVDSGRSSSLN